MRVPEKSAQKILPIFFHVYFVEKLNEIVYVYLKTKISSRYTNIFLEMYQTF